MRADPNALLANCGGGAFALHGLKVFARRRVNAPRVGGPNHGLRQRMLGACLDRGRDLQYFRLGVSRKRHDAAHLGTTFGERPRFIQRNRLQPGRGLHVRTPLHQHPLTRRGR